MSMLLEILGAALLIGACAALRLTLELCRSHRGSPAGCALHRCQEDCEQAGSCAPGRAQLRNEGEI
jgi:hypothetical protein